MFSRIWTSIQSPFIFTSVDLIQFLQLKQPDRNSFDKALNDYKKLDFQFLRLQIQFNKMNHFWLFNTKSMLAKLLQTLVLVSSDFRILRTIQYF